MAAVRRARSLQMGGDEGSSTPTQSRPPAYAAADSPFVRFMEFQPLPSPAAIAKARAASSPGPPIGVDALKENAPKQDMFSRLLAEAVAGVQKGPPRADSRGVALAKKPSLQQLSLATATASMEMSGAVERNAHEPPKEPKPFVHVPDVVDRAQADLAKRKERELQRTRALAAKIKRGPQPPSNVFLPRVDDSAEDEDTALISTDWEALPAGTKISVWWEGNQESFECTIRDWHVAVGKDGKLFYTHRCEYDGGTFDHDLSKCDFEVVEVAPDQVATLVTHSGDTPRGGPRFALGADAPIDGAAGGSGATGGGAPLTDRSDLGYVPESPSAAAKLGGDDDAIFANNFEELTPKRRWLAKQEAQLNEFCEELEHADIATPIHAMAGTQKLRGRIALKRVKQPQEATPRTPRANAGKLTSRFGPSALLGSPRTPRQDDGSGVPVVDPSNPAMTYRKPFQTPAGPQYRHR